MIGSKISKRMLQLLLILLVGVVLLAMKQAQAAVSRTEPAATYLNATVKHLNFNSEKTRSFDFDIKQEAKEKGATYSWYVTKDKGDKDVVTINSKTGVVSAKEAGTAYIHCKITKADGTVVKPEAKVIVRNNITKVAISNSPKNSTILAGNAFDFNRSILDTDAGKKVVASGITRWEIKGDTAGALQATDSGVVFPVKKGSFQIRAVCFQSKDKYNQWLKDKEGNKKYLTAASKWYQIKVKDNGGKAVVSDKDQLEKALAADNIKEITLSTKKELNLTIKEGNYKDKVLIVDAPNGEIENYALFKNVTIAAIKENTWVENTQGNSFHVTAIKIRIIVNGNAEIRDIIIDRENTEIEIEVGGTVQKITVLQSATMNLSGNGEEVPITIESTGSGTKITTSIPLEINAEEKAEIKVLRGAEGTKVKKTNKDITVDIENNSGESVSITSEDGEEEVVKAGERGTSGGTAQPTPTPTPTPTPVISGGGGGQPPVPTLESIAIKTPATKTEYKVGEVFDITGLTIEGTYSDGSKRTESITKANITGFSSAAVTSSQTLTITIGTKTTTYTITVIKADGVALTGVSSNDALNTMTGMTSAMEFSIDGSTWTEYNEGIPNLPDLTGTIKLYVRNKEADTHTPGPATEFSFTLGVLDRISIKQSADKLVYTVGDTLDISGLIVQGHYSDGAVKDETFSTANITGFDSTNVAESQELTITIGGKTATYTVGIQPITLSSVTITGACLAYEALTANITPVDATVEFSWLISDTIDGVYEVIPGETGKNYTIKLGDAGKYIKVSAKGTSNYDGTVTSAATERIQAYVESISLDKATLILYEDGDSDTLNATILPTEATDKSVTWISSDESIVTVVDGVVTPVSEGTAVVTVTSANAKAGSVSAACNVTVRDATPNNEESGITGIITGSLGSKKITIQIEVYNRDGEGIPNLSASDFTMDIKHGSDTYESISLTNSTWFEAFTEVGYGEYRVIFKGEKNNEAYTLINVKAKGVVIHSDPYGITTPRGEAPILLSATVSEYEWKITLKFNKAMKAPDPSAGAQFIIDTSDDVSYVPMISLNDDSTSMELSLSPTERIGILKDERVTLKYKTGTSSDKFIESEDEGLLADINDFEVNNQFKYSIFAHLSPPYLTESDVNDGSLSYGGVYIRLQCSFLERGLTKDDVRAVNLPEGMDYSIMSSGGKDVFVKISGSAKNHANSDDINNLYFVISKDVIKKATEDIVTNHITIDFITPAMTGAVSITGTNSYGEILTADITALVHVGTPTYTWLRDGEAISGATDKTYELSKEDIGKVISVRVTADGLTGSGSITSAATAVIQKASGLVLTGVTASDADNVITGMNSNMEFSTDGKTTWTHYSPESLALVDLTKDVTLWIRFKETDTHDVGPTSTFVFTEGTLESIEIISEASKKVYIVGDSLDITGLVIRGNYSDGGKRTLEFGTEDILGFNSENATDEQTLTITIEGCNVTYDITINPKPLEAIGNIIGTAKVGEALRTGNVTPEGATVEYQWLISDTMDGTFEPITGATGSEYIPVPGDAGKYIKVSVTGAGNYTGTVDSGATTKVLPHTTPSDDYSEFAMMSPGELGSKIVNLSITVKNKYGEGLSGLAAGDFRVDVELHTTSFTDTTYFRAFADNGEGNYTVQFIGQENAQSYSLQNLKVKDVKIHENLAVRTPDGIPPVIHSIAVSENGTKIIITFDKAIELPISLADHTIIVDGDGITPSGVDYYDTDNKQIVFSFVGGYTIYQEAVVKYTYTEDYISVDRGYLRGKSNLAVTNGSTVSGIIRSATVVIPPAKAGSIPATTAQVRELTNHPDFTVTNVTWSSECINTTSGGFLENDLCTVTIELTSKNNKQFQTEPFRPFVSRGMLIDYTTTSGSGKGNKVTFTVKYASEFILNSVAGVVGDIDGTIGSPRIWSISVENSKEILTVRDVVPIENGVAKLFTNSDFTGEITDTEFIPLRVGNNEVYIMVTTPDKVNTYYKVNINRKRKLSTDASLISVFGKTDPSPTGEGTISDLSIWRITVNNEYDTLNTPDIEAAEYAIMHTYEDNGFASTMALPISLNVGTNNIYIRIDAEVGGSKYYHVEINRLPAKEIEAIASISDITVEYDTLLSSIGLPTLVQVTLSDSSTRKLSVTWDSVTPVYDKRVAGTYTFEGTLSLPAGMINPGDLKAKVKVIVNAKKLGKGRLTEAINHEYSDGAARTAYKLSESDYTIDSWNAYILAINATISCEANEDATQEEIDEAIDILRMKKGELEFAGTEALNTAKAAAALLDESKFPTEKWAILISAFALPETSNAEILTKTSAINDALATLIELSNADISAAKALLPSTITVVEETHTNLLTILQEIVGMAELGVTLTVGSSDIANIGSDGTITYTDTAVTGNVIIYINKSGGTQQTASISITVPKKTIYALKPVDLSKEFGSTGSGYNINDFLQRISIEKEDDSEDITNLEYELSGKDPTAFMITLIGGWKYTLTDVEPSNVFWLYPAPGLPKGNYSAALTITADRGIIITGTLTFEVTD